MIDSSFIGGKKAGKTFATYINTSTTDTPVWREVDVIGDRGVEAVIPISNTITTRISEEIFDMVLGKSRNRLPQEYYINEKKKAVVLKWADDSITKVKVSKDDKFDARYGFLIAYFQKHCGLTKTQANKYLDNLKVEIGDKKEETKTIKKEKINIQLDKTIKEYDKKIKEEETKVRKIVKKKEV